MELKGSYQLTRPPKNDEELFACVKALWNVTIPRNKVCIEHQAPFDAFSMAFFAREPQVLVRGSRGLSGKSQMMSILGLTKAVILGCDVNIVGGSEQQSKNVLEHMKKAWDFENSPTYMIPNGGNRTQEMLLSNNSRIRPLTASQKSVRGPHPAALLLDEIDEMDPEILESAKGQPMPQPNWLGVTIPQQTLMVSTLQYADKAMMQEMQRFEEEGLPSLSWCYLDTSNPIDGWLSQEFIEQKRREVSKERWRVEYCTESTRQVLTKVQGWKQIQHVLPDDQVMTRQGWKRVSNVWDRGEREVVEITTASGQTFCCTPDHKIAAPGGWVAAASLSDGDPVLLGVHSGSLAIQTSSKASLVHSGASSRMSVLASSASCIDGVPVPVNDVLRPTHQFKMIGVYAAMNSASVVDGEFSRDGATEHQVTDPVCVGLTPKFGNHLDYQHSVLSSATSFTRGASLPYPAPVAVDGAVIPQGLLNVGGSLVLDHVVGVVPIGVRNTHDITVEDAHEYMTEGGFISHNCLGEPSIGNRAIDSDAVERTFDLQVQHGQTVKQEKEFEEYNLEEPRDDRNYVVAADWAKAVDWTVISVWDVTYEPMRLVYYVRLKRRPYPLMVGYFNDLKNRYQAEAIHDATGLGGVVADLIDGDVDNFLMTGTKRDNMLSEFVTAVENDKVRSHRIKSFYTSTKYCSTEDLFSRAKEFHLPDEVCSAALAWHLAKDRIIAVAPFGAKKNGQNFMQHDIAHNNFPQEQYWEGKSTKSSDMEVVIKDEYVEHELNFTG